MKKWGRRLFSVAFSFMFLFISIGYAQVADMLTLTGTSEYIPAYDKVIFTSAELVSAVGVSSESAACYYPTNVGNTMVYDGSSDYMTTTYKITATNYSANIKYAYIGIVCDELMDNNNSMYSNGTLGVEFYTILNGVEEAFTVGMPVEVGQTITLYVRYTVSKENIPAEGTVESLLNFKFGFHTDSANEAATQEIFSQFTNILNDPAKMEQINTQIENAEKIEGAEDWLGFKSRDYIGNVASSLIGEAGTANEQAAIESLFGDTLKINTVNANGETETHDVQVIIQRKNIYGTEEEELILYMTTVDIYSLELTSAAYVDNIYATVFVNDQNTGWFQIGDMYVGKAKAGRINTAGGSPSWLFRADSFSPDTWISVASEYKVTDDYSYSISNSHDISTVVNMEVETSAWELLNNLHSVAHGIQVDNYAADAETKNALINARTNVGVFIASGIANANQPIVVSAIKQLQTAMAPFGY